MDSVWLSPKAATQAEVLEPGASSDACASAAGKADSTDAAMGDGRPLPPRGRHYRLAWLEEDARREANMQPERSPSWWSRRSHLCRSPDSSGVPPLRLVGSPVMGAGDPYGSLDDGLPRLRLSLRQRDRQAAREASGRAAEATADPSNVPAAGLVGDEVMDDVELDGVYCSQRLGVQCAGAS